MVVPAFTVSSKKLWVGIVLWSWLLAVLSGSLCNEAGCLSSLQQQQLAACVALSTRVVLKSARRSPPPSACLYTASAHLPLSPASIQSRRLLHTYYLTEIIFYLIVLI